MEEIKDIVEILELAKEEIENNDENITATLDLQDLKSLKNLYELYKKEIEKNKKIFIQYEKRVNELEREIAINSISKDKIREIIGELEKQEDWYAENKSLDDLYGKIDILQELLEEGN